MSPRGPGSGKRPSSRQDRAIAMVIWVITGVLFGVALGVFTGRGWLFLAVGAVAGVLAAVFRTRPAPELEQD